MCVDCVFMYMNIYVHVHVCRVHVFTVSLCLQVRPYEYDLVLSSDINSARHHQWFYFRVSCFTIVSINYTIQCVGCYQRRVSMPFIGRMLQSACQHSL